MSGMHQVASKLLTLYFILHCVPLCCVRCTAFLLCAGPSEEEQTIRKIK